ncbi:MAG: hypothetical protein KME26_32260 [Oscillatoria princeps RMCB-10]|nr:hypothetical protein [Oscillatoria princeps RMCB-10]
MAFLLPVASILQAGCRNRLSVSTGAKQAAPFCAAQAAPPAAAPLRAELRLPPEGQICRARSAIVILTEVTNRLCL